MQENRREAILRERRRRKRIFRIKQVCFFTVLGVLACLLVIGLFRLLSIPFRGNGQQEVNLIQKSMDEKRRPEEPEEVVPESVTISLVAFGDNLIHNTIYEYAWQEDGTYDFSEIYTDLREEIRTADLACIQQETILVSDPSMYSNYPEFGTPADMADTLAALGFDVICHASNHTYDKGMTGISDTLEKWKQYPEMAVLGIHASREDADRITVVEREGIRFALLDYTYGLNGTYPEDDYTIDFATLDNRERIAAQIAEGREKADLVIVFLHMGDEDDMTPGEEQKEWVQFLADAGAGLVIGTSSHTIQPMDVVTGKDGNQMPVFYCLGNFVSSQRENINLIGAMAKAEITQDSQGTRVTDFSVEPVVTLIQGGSGKPGNGYIFRVKHLEDYDEELAKTHIREDCMPEDFWSIWNSVFGT